jgi:uncharacterized protein YbjQ (UPF0145 family)
MGGFSGGGLVAVVGSRASLVSYAPYVDALRAGRDTALGGMLAEAAAVGADGVVGVRLTDLRLDGVMREITALGTAVRSRGRQRAGRPFTTDLGGQDVAKLIAAGWVPAGIAYGISVAVRHDDYRTRSQAGLFSGNIEVSGYADLMNHVRAGARRDFAGRAARAGADAALLTSMHHHIWSYEPRDNHRDHVAECVVTGNAVARFHAGSRAPTTSLTILPLRPSTEKER